MAHPMTDEQARAFLAEGSRTGKLATSRADGRPHVTPIWFVLDGDDLVFMTGADTVKGRTLRRDPRAALTVDLEEPPYAFVMVEGSVTISEDLEEMLPLSIAIARRYVGDAEAEQYGRRNAVPGELLVRLRPDKIVAVADLMG
ncbi:PPOX class F420-dependent oxidoreductase [Jatrophihabitans sp.]|jgi:PPOX class probable F420-dependent enzyme|uniref:PPOX class F420-dependent oxidoreductase n=1 Tax=Jatrophihabitans sp. TaxID=1932789 RepID=UPI0038CD2DA3